MRHPRQPRGKNVIPSKHHHMGNPYGNSYTERWDDFYQEEIALKKAFPGVKDSFELWKPGRIDSKVNLDMEVMIGGTPGGNGFLDQRDPKKLPRVWPKGKKPSCSKVKYVSKLKMIEGVVEEWRSFPLPNWKEPDPFWGPKKTQKKNKSIQIFKITGEPYEFKFGEGKTKDGIVDFELNNDTIRVVNNPQRFFEPSTQKPIDPPVISLYFDIFKYSTGANIFCEPAVLRIENVKDEIPKNSYLLGTQIGIWSDLKTFYNTQKKIKHPLSGDLAIVRVYYRDIVVCGKVKGKIILRTRGVIKVGEELKILDMFVGKPK